MKISLECPNCKKIFERDKRYFNFSEKNGWKIYCSSKCQKEYNSLSIIEKCKNCGKDVEIAPSRKKRSKTGNVYCSRSCSAANNNKLFKKWENHPNYKNGETGYRNLKLNSVTDPKCERCGFDNILALEVHHKDRNRRNNKIDNLEILCCNCHTIEHKNKTEDIVYAGSTQTLGV